MRFKIASVALGSLLVVVLTILTNTNQIEALSPQAVDGASLIENAKSLDGQNVTFQGEVIGDIMQRQDHYWINVSDNGTAIGVWITAEQRQAIQLCGQYGIEGDQVQITGLFFQACSEHGGDLDLHAISLVKVNSGRILPQQLDLTRLVIAVALFIIAGICLIILIRKSYPGMQIKTR